MVNGHPLGETSSYTLNDSKVSYEGTIVIVLSKKDNSVSRTRSSTWINKGQIKNYLKQTSIFENDFTLDLNTELATFQQRHRHVSLAFDIPSNVCNVHFPVRRTCTFMRQIWQTLQKQHGFSSYPTQREKKIISPRSQVSTHINVAHKNTRPWKSYLFHNIDKSDSVTCIEEKKMSIISFTKWQSKWMFNASL